MARDPARRFGDAEEMLAALVDLAHVEPVEREPEPIASGPHSQAWRETYNFVPRTLIVRARKEGN